MSKVAFLGTGAMGSRMAANLLKSGHAVTVWNRDARKLAPLVDQGAQAAASPRSAVKDTEYVISMVRDDDASRGVWLDPAGGALAGMAHNAVAIESSTLTVEWVKELATDCNQQGIAMLDAPVAGSRPQAEAAQLIYLVGGEEAVCERAKPLLLAMGGAVHYAGPSGSGAAVKLMVNALLGIQLATMGELMGFARRAGLDEAKVVEILAATPVCSPAAKLAAEAMLKSNFSPMFPIELVAKDLAYVMRHAASDNAHLPMAESAHNVFAQAVAKGYGQDNITGVVKLYQGL